MCACTVSLQCAFTVLHTVCRMLPRTPAYIYIESRNKGDDQRLRDVTQSQFPFLKDVSLVEFMYLVFTRVPCELLRATPAYVVVHV